MKKFIRLLFVSSLAAAVLCSCGSGSASSTAASSEAAPAEASSASSESADAAASAAQPAEQEDDILAQVDDVNSDFEGLLEQYGSFLFTYDYVQDGLQCTIYRAEDSFMQFDSAGYVFINEDSAYGRDSEAENDYFKICVFSDADEETMRDNMELIPWYTSDLLEGETEIKEDNGTLIITVDKEASEEDKQAVAEAYGIEAEKIQGFEYRLEADPDTLLIHRIVYSLDCGSTGILVTDINAEAGAARPETPEGMEDFLNASDVRTVTFVMDPGTAEEATYEETVRRGCSCGVMSQNYDMYSDPECTQVFEGAADLTQDLTVYLVTR